MGLQQAVFQEVFFLRQALNGPLDTVKGFKPGFLLPPGADKVDDFLKRRPGSAAKENGSQYAEEDINCNFKDYLLLQQPNAGIVLRLFGQQTIIDCTLGGFLKGTDITFPLQGQPAAL